MDVTGSGSCSPTWGYSSTEERLSYKQHVEVRFLVSLREGKGPLLLVPPRVAGSQPFPFHLDR